MFVCLFASHLKFSDECSDWSTGCAGWSDSSLSTCASTGGASGAHSDRAALWLGLIVFCCCFVLFCFVLFCFVFFFGFFVVHRNRQESGCEGSDWNALMRALIRVLVVRMCIFASEGGVSEEYSYVCASAQPYRRVRRGLSGTQRREPDCTETHKN